MLTFYGGNCKVQIQRLRLVYPFLPPVAGFYQPGGIILKACGIMLRSLLPRSVIGVAMCWNIQCPIITSSHESERLELIDQSLVDHGKFT